MTPQSLLEKRVWAKEFEIEGFRFNGLTREETAGSLTEALVNAISRIRKALA